jgi:hypothetical protein
VVSRASVPSSHRSTPPRFLGWAGTLGLAGSPRCPGLTPPRRFREAGDSRMCSQNADPSSDTSLTRPRHFRQSRDPRTCADDCGRLSSHHPDPTWYFSTSKCPSDDRSCDHDRGCFLLHHSDGQHHRYSAPSFPRSEDSMSEPRSSYTTDWGCMTSMSATSVLMQFPFRSYGHHHAPGAASCPPGGGGAG